MKVFERLKIECKASDFYYIYFIVVKNRKIYIGVILIMQVLVGYMADENVSKQRITMPVAELVFCDLDLLVYDIKGRNNGPKVSIVGMTHGTEYIGAKVIEALYEELDPEELNGSITAIPIANPLAAAAKTYGTPAGFGNPFLSVNMNRSYPGNADGNLTERLAAKVFSLASNADYLIDIHSGTIYWMNYPSARIRTDEGIDGEVIEKARNLAKFSGLDARVETKSSDIYDPSTGGILNTQAMLRGIPAVTFELFGGYVEKEHVDAGLRAVTNILKGVGSLKGEPDQGNQRVYTKITKINSPKAGMIEFVKQPGDIMKKGEVYARIKNLKTGEISDLTAPADGLLECRMNHGFVNEGDYVSGFLSQRTD